MSESGILGAVVSVIADGDTITCLLDNGNPVSFHCEDIVFVLSEGVMRRYTGTQVLVGDRLIDFSDRSIVVDNTRLF